MSASPLTYVDASGDCWEWTGGHSSTGYGAWGPRAQKAHRAVWELLVSPIPKGMTLDHLCRNRGCVNPDHLEVVTMRENVLRGVGPSAVNARKTHCVHGHPFDERNTGYQRKGRYKTHATRYCRACGRERWRLEHWGHR
jgi:hypothetical protein